MAGHSKWANIKHRKAAVDAKRGKLWTRLSRQITMAAKGGSSIEDNPTLRLAVDKAKSANMPKDTIDRAIKKGSGELGGANYEEVIYEGYGPAGVAVFCKCLTDNRNRTAPEIKKLFDRSGGKLGTSNCVAWMFSQLGIILIERDKAEEDTVIDIALEAGADDVSTSEAGFEIQTTPEAFLDVKDALDAASIEYASADVEMVAGDKVTLDLETTRKVLKLVDALDDHDDVESVSSNLDVADDMMNQLE